MQNKIQEMSERMDDFEGQIKSAKDQADSAKARVIILQEAVEILQKHANLPPDIAIQLKNVMDQL
jgi:archaellum component FlaC